MNDEYLQKEKRGRDEFSPNTKKLLESRAKYKCAKCRKPTLASTGDSKNSLIEDAVKIGEAAHICAASKKGARYCEWMTAEERKSVDNGIWLCRKCHELVDSDVHEYTIGALYKMKFNAELVESIKISEEDKNVINEIKDIFESDDVTYMLRDAKVYPYSDVQKTTVIKLLKLYKKLISSSNRYFKDSKLQSLVDDLVRAMGTIFDRIAFFKNYHCITIWDIVSLITNNLEEYFSTGDYKWMFDQCFYETWKKYDVLIQYYKVNCEL